MLIFIHALRQVVKRSRAKNRPLEPQSIDIRVPDDLKMFNDEPFLISNTRFNKDGCVLIFSIKNNIRVLKESPIWIMDGTFQCCPKLYLQLYSIHGIVGDPGYLKQSLLYMLFNRVNLKSATLISSNNLNATQTLLVRIF
jgi:hypothetical protein